MNLKTSALAILAALVALPSTATSDELRIGGIRFGNPFNSATWWDAGEGDHHAHAMSDDINLADPAYWMGWIAPEKHAARHMAMMNPATWAQFAKPETYLRMADARAWMQWADPGSYRVLADPQTYAYWAQPGAYIHAMNPEAYAHIVDTSTMGPLTDTMKRVIGATIPGDFGKDMIGPMPLPSEN